MLNHVLGESGQVLALNELHFVDRKWKPGSGEVWSRDRAVHESAKMLATARRSIWRNVPTSSELDEAKAIVESVMAAEIAPLDVYQETLLHLCENAKKSIVIDQTPRNIHYAAELLNEFPQSHVIQIVRDPRAVLYSQRNRWRQRWLGASQTPFTQALRVWVNYHAITASRLWQRAYESGKSLCRHPRFMQIRFEDLVSGPEDCIRTICSRLGIEFDKRMLDAPRVGSSNLRHEESSKGIMAAVADEWRGKQPRADTWICQMITLEACNEMHYELEETGKPIVGVLFRVLIFPIHAIGALLFNPRLAYRMSALMKKSRGQD